MGRLQRKKTSGKSKKKRQSTNTAAAPKLEGAVGAKNAALPAESQKDTPSLQVVSQKKPSIVAKSVSGRHEKKYLAKGIQFLREVKVELKKVTWPSRKQTVGSTVVVIILVMVVSLFLGVVDNGLSLIIRLVLQ